jgi:protein phosphatase
MSASPDPVTPPALTACGYTQPGRQREDNEDAFGTYLDERLFIVADGMGGRASGEVASRMAVDELERYFRAFHADPRQPWPFPVDRKLSLGANLLRVGVQVANREIRAAAAAEASRHRMASTLVAMAVGDSQLTIAHVGDARAYRVRQGTLKRLTRDHSILEEMLAARPDMTQEEIAAFAHKNVVTKALGSKEQVEPTLYLNTFEYGDTYLLCCDGLWGPVPDESIGSIITATPDLEEACQRLIDAANDAGGPDNVTAVLVRIG